MAIVAFLAFPVIAELVLDIFSTHPGVCPVVPIVELPEIVVIFPRLAEPHPISSRHPVVIPDIAAIGSWVSHKPHLFGV